MTDLNHLGDNETHTLRISSQALASPDRSVPSPMPGLNRAVKRGAERAGAALNAVRIELAALNSETTGLNPYAMAGRRDAAARVHAALDARTNPGDTA
ncbi:hypothetical protein ACLF6K_05945 [Streptomyces xanthophaeus]|uniref:hypothetical protein n=1 Tax=Streptomyces xanthophaeus TaxID=67385 RepID=UPI0039902264